jgi:hypothetical protein
MSHTNPLPKDHSSFLLAELSQEILSLHRSRLRRVLTIYGVLWSLRMGGALPYKNQIQLKFKRRLSDPAIWKGSFGRRRFELFSNQLHS